jgi:transcriptional regulator with XRE-family HTH domain
MSTRDREILKAARITQQKVADLFGITLQGVNRGISAEAHYLTAERLGKLIDFLEGIDAEKANILREHLYKIVENGESVGVKANTSYIQLQTFRDILKREQEDLIWIPVDPLTRLQEEIDFLRDYIKNTERRLVIVTCEHIEDLRAVIDERIYRFDFDSVFKGKIVVIHSETASFTPEMLLASKAVFVKTVFGFQMLRENEGDVVLNRFFKQTKISPNYLPIKLGNGYTKALQYSCSPTARALTVFLNELPDISPELDISSELPKHLKKVVLNIEKNTTAPVEDAWTELYKLVDDIKTNCGESDATNFTTGIERLKLKYG